MLEEFLLENGIMIESEELYSVSSRSLILVFPQKYSQQIQKKIHAPLGLESVKISAEMQAKMKFGAPPFNCIENVEFVSVNPYKLKIQAIDSMIATFVINLLKN